VATKRSISFGSQGTLSVSTETSNFGLLLITNSIKYLIHLYFFRATVLDYSSVKYFSSCPGVRVVWNVGPNQNDICRIMFRCGMVVGCACMCCDGCTITVPMTVGKLQRRCILQAHNIQGRLFHEDHDVTLFLSRSALKLPAVSRCYCSEKVFSGVTLRNLTFWCRCFLGITFLTKLQVILENETFITTYKKI
jgi:hypothetical protein